jgi:transcriptional regulator with XRE-family HTH domain
MSIPPRSRLYHMAPIGVGTGFVESASGYSSRLALSHNITLAVLFGYEIAPLLNKNHLRNSEARSNKNALLSNSFRRLAPAVDGHGITAETYTASLQKLTMRNDLRFLTMLPWKEVISHRHLLRQKRVWCPACYCEWRNNRATIYEPLFWSLEIVTVCIRHRQRLRSRCHHCKQELLPLASRSYPGYCPMCHAWLGGPAQSGFTPKEFMISGHEFEWQSWVYEQTCKLLAVAPTLTMSPPRLVLSDSISRCIRASLFKTESTFARSCGMSQSSVNDLCRGASVPQLSTLMRISFATRVTAIDIVLGRGVDPTDVQISSSLDNEQSQLTKDITPIQHWSTSKARKVRHLFEGLLKANPPLPMVEISKRLKHPRSTLLSRFPDLCQKAVIRYKTHVENCRREFWIWVGEN